MADPPEQIDGYRVLEYGFFPQPTLPLGYVPPPDASPPLSPVQNLAICAADGVDGFYLLFCTPDWSYVTYCFQETMEFTKRVPVVEFGHDVIAWHKAC